MCQERRAGLDITFGPGNLNTVGAEVIVSLKDRISDVTAAEFSRLALPAPIHALNLVNFRDKRSYRLYGLLLTPLAIALGARPLWAAVLDERVRGADPADEIVIVGYPSAKALVDTVRTGYYSWVNRWRVRGVRRLEFALTERTAGSVSLRTNGRFLVVQHAGSPGLRDRMVARAAPHLGLQYAAVVRAGFPALVGHAAGDPEPVRFRELLLLGPAAARGDGRGLKRVAADIGGLEGDMALHWYRTIGLLEALPL